MAVSAVSWRGSCALGKPVVVVDFSAKQLEMLRAFNVQAYFGDATRPDMLHAAGIADAKVLVVAIDNKDQITEVVRYVKHNYPKVHVVARAFDRFHVYELYEAGADDIIRETFDSSVRAGRSVLEAIGMTRPEAEQVTHAFVENDQMLMLAMAEAYEPGVPVPENPAMLKAAHEAAVQIETAMRQVRDEIMAAREAAGQPIDAPLTTPLEVAQAADAADNLAANTADNLSDDTRNAAPT